MTRERRIQNGIRNALVDEGLFFRANVGKGWTGEAERVSRSGVRFVPDGSVILRDARPFDTGLPPGFSDLFGARPVKITADMVGQTLAVFTAIEVKTKTGRVQMRQERFLDAVSFAGGIAGVARSVDDALIIIGAR